MHSHPFSKRDYHSKCGQSAPARYFFKECPLYAAECAWFKKQKTKKNSIQKYDLMTRRVLEIVEAKALNFLPNFFWVDDLLD